MNNLKMHTQNIFKSIYKYIKKLLSATKSYLMLHPIFQYFLISFVVMIVAESFNRRSVAEAFGFMISRPHVFALGYLMVLSMVSVSHMLKKRNFWKYFISLFWIIISLVSYIVYSVRRMPFSFNDLFLIPSTFTVLPLYLNIFQVVLIAVLALLLVMFIVWLYKRSVPVEINLKRCIIFPLCVIVITVSYFCFARYNSIVDNRVSGLINKYEHNGFVYCFVSSILERGMSEPEEYSVSEVASIVHEINSGETEKSQKPNIIFLQLESFFDVNNIKAYSYSENPIPVFTSLEEKFSHGYLSVPTFSAGTANTEFEVISGMDVDFFGIGEVAYQTVVKDLPIETVCHTLKPYGYTTHAIHNNSASFYDRNLIYRNLGFDTFTSLEYMYDVEYNILGWAKDKTIADSIDDCLSSSEGRDFVYAVGVQSHGTYPSTYDETVPVIDVTGIEDKNVEAGFEYYLGQIRQVDAFVGDLIERLDKRDEPTVLVVFGDHLPGFEVDDSQLHNNSKYQTGYAIWSNFDMDCVVKDLTSYQLYSYILDRLDMEGGTISNLHRKYSFTPSDEYKTNLEIIQYDVLYGDGISFADERPDAVDTAMGIRKISIKEARADGENLVVTGNNFNEFSKVTFGTTVLDTVYVGKTELVVENFDSNTDRVCVSQIDQKGRILSSTGFVAVPEFRADSALDEE